jgi:hypothetical protein
VTESNLCGEKAAVVHRFLEKVKELFDFEEKRPYNSLGSWEAAQ